MFLYPIQHDWFNYVDQQIWIIYNSPQEVTDLGPREQNLITNSSDFTKDRPYTYFTVSLSL